MAYIGNDVDATFIPSSVNTSTDLRINGGALTQTGGDVNLDGGTFFLDESANRVGIGTITPGVTLDVVGTIRATNINALDLSVEDKNIVIGDVASPTNTTADGGGVTLKGATDKTIAWLNATAAWTFSEHISIASAKEYRIAGTKVLDATSLGSAVVSSSLTSVGTIASGTWQGTAIADTYLGTISTALKVSNSATTATSANTASAIVARDASGNFTAETITAALTGAASSNVLKAGDTMTGALVVPLASAATPSLTFTGDLNTGIYSPGANQLAVATNGTGRLFVDGNGQVSVVGASTLTTNLTVNGATSFSSSLNWNFPGLLLRRTNSNIASAKQISLLLDGDTESDTTLTNYLNIWGTYSGPPTTSSTSTGLSASMNLGAPNAFIAHTNGSERLRIDSSGRLLVGVSSARSNLFNTTIAPAIQLEGAGIVPSQRFLSVINNFATAGDGGGVMVLGRSKGGTVGSNTIVAANDQLGRFDFQGNDGTDFVTGATIEGYVDGTPGTNDMPGRLVFSTTADGASTPTERMRINSSGQILAGALGTAALPIISFLNNPNTGIYSPGANQVAVATNGTGRLFVDASGNVAIAQTPSNAASFTRSFNISALDASIALRGNSGGTYTDQGIFFAVDGVNYSQIYNDGIGQLIFRTGSGLSERLRITSAGLVGIGTSAPGARLHVGIASLSGNWSGFFGENLASAIAPPANYGLALGYNRSNGSGEANIAYGTGTGTGLGLIFGSYDGTTYTNRVIFDGAGNVGIGTTSPGSALEINAAAATSPFIAKINTSEAARIDSSGRLLIGSSSSISTLIQPYLQIHGTSENAFMSANRWSNDAFGTALILGKSRGGAVGTRGAVSNGDSLGEIIFAGDNGSSFSTGGSITCAVDGAVSGGGSGDMPSRMSFNTTPDGTQNPVERMRIRSDGNVGIGTVGIANIRLYTLGSDTSASNFTYYGTNSVGTQIFSVRNDGAFNTGTAALSPYNLTTAAAANCVINADGYLYRSTSSARFKTDIQTLEDSYADALLDVRPVWYRSIAPGDTTHSDWGYWGFIAEEVAEIDPRLVFWKTHETQKDEDNNDIQVELEEPLAEGVQYDRFVPHLLNLIKRQQQAIETLEAKVAALEST